jgi:hypothetical protein
VTGSAFAVTVATNAPAPATEAQDDSTPAPTESNDASAPAPESDENPYSAISKANVFQLKEPPPPPKHDDPAILNLPKVNITGFRKRDGEPMRALFATVPKDPKETAKYFNLAEGEKEDILELKHIDPSQESVDVIIAGTPMTLTVKSNSFVQPLPKSAVATTAGFVAARPPQPIAPPMATPGFPNVPGAPGAPAGADYNHQGGGVIVAGGGSGNTAVPGATVTSYGNPQPNPAINNPGVPSTGDSALRSIPTRIPIPQRDVRSSNPNYNPGGLQQPQ